MYTEHMCLLNSMIICMHMLHFAKPRQNVGLRNFRGFLCEARSQTARTAYSYYYAWKFFLHI